MLAKTIFLDRDGIINVDKGYVYKISDFELVENILQSLKLFQELGYQLIIVTNQAGIAKGFYSEKDYFKLTNYYLNLLRINDISIKKVYFCPHHINGINPRYKINCNCRKPKPGMIEMAIKDHSVDVDNSIMIGDNLSDMKAGIKAKIKNNFLIADKAQTTENLNYKIFPNLADLCNEIRTL